MKNNVLEVVNDETDETNDDYQRKPDGKFAPGNKGGPGGSRPGSGRRPKPADETLTKRLYDLLDSNADRALEVLVSQLEHEDPKIAQKAASIVLSKTLPEGRFLKSWEQQTGEVNIGQLECVKSWLAWKRDQDIAEAEDEGKRESETEDKGEA